MDNVRPLHKSASTRAPTIALHCSGSSAAQWDAYRTLMPYGAQLHAAPLMGYETEQWWPNGKPVTLQLEAQRLLPLLRAQGRPVHLVGHSYGGAVALQAALLWPEHVLSLTLYEPVLFHLLFADRASTVHATTITGVGRRIALLSMAGQQLDAAELFVGYWSGPAAWPRMSPARRDAIKLRMPKVRAEFEALFNARLDLSGLRESGLPIRLVRGTTSPAPARRVSELLASQLPACEVITLEGMAHMAPVTHRELLAPCLFHGAPAADFAVAA